MDAEEAKQRLAASEYILVAPTTKEVWKAFDLVHNANDEPVDYIQCKRRDSV